MIEEGEFIDVPAKWGKRFVEMPDPIRGENYIARFYFDPPQREWVGLTNDEVNGFAAGCHLGKSVQGAIFEAEAALRSKNT